MWAATLSSRRVTTKDSKFYLNTETKLSAKLGKPTLYH